MKNRFAEYYKPTEAEVQDLWNTATIVFDTNVLLDLYRYDTATRDEFIQIITFYKERLWIPYQVGWEFHRNREVVIKQNEDAYDRVRNEFCDKIDEFLNNAEDMANNHPLLNISDIKRRSKTFKSAVEKSLLPQKKAHPVIDNTNDVVLNTITELFEGRTGENFSEEDLTSIKKEYLDYTETYYNKYKEELTSTEKEFVVKLKARYYAVMAKQELKDVGSALKDLGEQANDLINNMLK